MEASHFQLYRRAKHVFSEALRVLEFRDVCLGQSNSQSAAGDAVSIPRELGRLMDESHVSCSTLCENSCPEVDTLCRLAKEAGAYGSRVTGRLAFVVAVAVVSDDVKSFIDDDVVILRCWMGRMHCVAGGRGAST